MNLLKNCFALVCIISLIIPITIGNVGKSTNSFQMETAIIETSQTKSRGLQNSSWPMFHHDARHTGISSYGANGNWYSVKWKFRMDGMTISSPAIDVNGTIYIGANDFQKSFYAIDSNGTEKWYFGVEEFIFSSPALGYDNVIYVGSNDGGLYAFYPNGTEKWRVSLGTGWVASSPVIDNDGTIYAASVISSKLCAVHPNGSIIWEFYAQDWIYCSASLDQEGNIYVGSNDGYMYAIYPNGTLKWKFYAGGEKGIGSAPSIANDGTIYCGGTSGYLYALYPNGTLRWKFGTGYIGGSCPAIGIDGTIYIGDQDNYRIYSIDKDGNLNWYYTTKGEIISSPAIDKNGIVYCGSMDGNLYALNPDGSLRWKFDAGDSIESSVAIGDDGTVYVAAQFLPSDGQEFRTYLYALCMVNNQPPLKPKINGPNSGNVKQKYNYTLSSTDPEGNNLSYYVDWGDGTNSGWIGSFPSGQVQTVNHTWNKKGIYIIKVKARDVYDAESDWGTLSVTMPYEPQQFPFIHWLLERFPNAFPLLRYLLQQIGQ